MADKNRSLDSLAKLFGAFKEDGNKTNLDESYEEMIARLEREEKEKKDVNASNG